MKYRISLLFASAILITLTLLLTAHYSIGPHAISFNEPYELIINIAFTLLLFLPALILGVFKYTATGILSGIWQLCFAFIFIMGGLVLTFISPIILLLFMLFLTGIVLVISSIVSMTTR
ncbi:hypothetical protein CD110_08355 [Staphylococcus casei]|uniref:hypothetical protein n=1 Tax=Staphylococcus TaxID=1279 RepID=UPI000CD1B8E9|nr:hypothetical protein [Staphylococcus casei]PNZ58992.1 hypothetical protein CD110_08355 [Staphylococcus casei]PTI78235.1 hypothetical protein BU064_08350 [Staphylococcus succinus]WJE86589.1 hypothetical protein QMO72_01090 [Staphylococcus casei]